MARILDDLQQRCERMLAMEIAVVEDTVRVDKAIGLKSDQKPTRADEQTSLQLSDRNLLDILAELKMIRSMQVRVNGRTTTYAKQYQGELAQDGEIQKELNNLAQRQQKIFEVTNNLARGKNQ